jgi:hypothetical protein
MKLHEYYKKSMGNFMRLSNYENQPILHPRYEMQKESLES